MSALAHLLQKRGLKREQLVCMGDGMNDLEMMHFAGMGVAMGNAEEELKALADYVTLPIEQDGILDALEKLGVI